MNATSIGWTDFTSNPIRYRDATDKMVWGCERLSPACAHCYAAELAKRYRRGAGEFTAEEMATYTPYFDEPEARKILTAKTIGGTPVSGSRCFIGDMTDVFGEWVPDELLDKLFAVMALRSGVTFQVLTKRPERMRAYLSSPSRVAPILFHAIEMAGDFDGRPEGGLLQSAFLLEELWQKGQYWPLPNVWIGTSVENQHWANIRIPILLEIPAAVRFVSIEPLLGQINFTLRGSDVQGWDEDWRYDVLTGEEWAEPRAETPERSQHLDWGIIGGESGSDLRDPGLSAIVDVARQFERAGVALFVKQDVHRRPGQQGRIPDDIWAVKQFPAVAA